MPKQIYEELQYPCKTPGCRRLISLCFDPERPVHRQGSRYLYCPVCRLARIEERRRGALEKKVAQQKELAAMAVITEALEEKINLEEFNFKIDYIQEAFSSFIQTQVEAHNLQDQTVEWWFDRWNEFMCADISENGFWKKKE